MNKKRKFKSFVEWYVWALKEARKEYKRTGRVPNGFVLC